MKHFTRRRLFGGILTGAGAAIVTVPATARLQDEVYVPVAPPPPRTEAIPVLRAERVEVERWQPGYWHWNGYEHLWTEGRHVARPRQRAEWISGRWDERPRGWVFVEGHWN
ncbi:hypothetical protein [Reyranella sp.]|uniref:hypothetical protein n=1 Tax=Reyranella sp. TaxID=1929291 RepID=UPI003D12793E